MKRVLFATVLASCSPPGEGPPPQVVVEPAPPAPQPQHERAERCPWPGTVERDDGCAFAPGQVWRIRPVAIVLRNEETSTLTAPICAGAALQLGRIQEDACGELPLRTSYPPHERLALANLPGDHASWSAITTEELLAPFGLTITDTQIQTFVAPAPFNVDGELFRSGMRIDLPDAVEALYVEIQASQDKATWPRHDAPAAVTFGPSSDPAAAQIRATVADVAQRARAAVVTSRYVSGSEDDMDGDLVCYRLAGETLMAIKTFVFIPGLYPKIAYYQGGLPILLERYCVDCPEGDTAETRLTSRWFFAVAQPIRAEQDDEPSLEKGKAEYAYAMRLRELCEGAPDAGTSAP